MHWKLGNVRWNMIPRVGLFTAAGAAFGGSVLAVNAPEELLLGSCQCTAACCARAFQRCSRCRGGLFVLLGQPACYCISFRSQTVDDAVTMRVRVMDAPRCVARFLLLALLLSSLGLANMRVCCW